MASLKHTTDEDDSIQPSEKVAEQYKQAERKFLTLAQDVHLPSLDIKIIEKYFVKTKTAKRLEHLKLVNEALEQHRLATIRILKLVGEREGVLKTIKAKASEFGSRKLSTLEAQSTVLRLLYQHQQLSLSIIEAIFLWREALTRPYPFQVHGENYLRKIVNDCVQIESSQLKTILPLRLGQFPLCSNISALKMFSQKPAAASAGVKEARPPHAAIGPLSPSRGGGTPKTPGKGGRAAAAAASSSHNDDDAAQELTGRLRAAESVLFAEKKLQLRLMRELVALADKGQFVLLLHMPEIIPNCGTAIQITDEALESQLKESMQAALKHAEQDDEPAPADDEPESEADEEGDQEEEKSAARTKSSPKKQAPQQPQPTSSSPASSPASTRPSSPASSDRSSRQSSAASSRASTPRGNPHQTVPAASEGNSHTAAPRVPSPTAPPPPADQPTTCEPPPIVPPPPPKAQSAYDDEFEDDD